MMRFAFLVAALASLSWALTLRADTDPADPQGAVLAIGGLLAEQRIEEAELRAQRLADRWELEVEDRATLAGRLADLAQVFLDARRFDLARARCERVVELYAGTTGHDLDLALAHVRLAWCLDGLGMRQNARTHEATARRLITDAPSSPPLGWVLEELGWLRYDLTDTQQAADDWSRALAIFRAADEPDVPRIVWGLANLSELERGFGHFDTAESLQVEAVRLGREHLPRDANFATLLNSLGNLYWNQARFDLAEQLGREALQVSEASGASASRRAVAELSLAVLAREQGKLDEAGPRFERALALAREASGPADADLTVYLTETGLYWAQRGRLDQAVPLWQEAVEILEHLDIPREVYHALLLHTMGRAFLEQGQLDEAEVYLTDALRRRESVLGPDHPDVGVTLTALARLHARREDGVQRAGSEIERAISILSASSVQPDVLAEALALKARLEHRGGDFAAARTDLDRALDLVERLRPERGGGDETRARLLQKFATYYNDMIVWLSEQGQLEEALQYAERIRARVLRDQLAAGRVDLRRGIPPEVLVPLERRQRDARIRINQTRRALAEARSRWTASAAGLSQLTDLESDLDLALENFETASQEIRQRSPSWRRLLRDPAERLPLDRVRHELLGPGRVLLYYQVGSVSTCLFVCTEEEGSLRRYELQLPPDLAQAWGETEGPVTSDLLERAVAGDATAPGFAGILRGVTGASPLGRPAERGASVPRTGHQLWRLLVPAQVWDRVRSAEEVVLVPDGALHALPFEALVVDPEGPVYWLDEGPPVRYAHSLTTLLDVHDRAPGEGGPDLVLTLSDPAFARMDEAGAVLPRLPATRRESEAIRAAFGPERVVSLMGADAGESRLKSLISSARYVHLATHGLVHESGHELLASLALAEPEPDDPEDGFLHLFEIYELDLQCDLAVLSACETKRGKRIEGEGVFALSRGFLSAGAQRTVASLWSVADESTAMLMAEFFRGVAVAEREGGPIPYTKLLHQAKVALRRTKKWSQPFFWAPFVLSGIQG